MTAAEAKILIAKIYVGYYGRSPEPEGWNYWIGEAIKANALTPQQIAASYSVQPESTAQYPFLKTPLTSDPTEFIKSVYQNLFNRDPDAEGLAYWKGELAKAAGDPQATGAMIINIISGAKDDANGNDKTTLNNKVEVAMDWGTSVGSISNLDYENNPAAKASAKGVLSEVTDQGATVQVGKAKTDAYVASGGQPTYTLSVDSPSVTEGDAGTKVLTFLISLDKPATSNVSINYQTTNDGTATAGEDFSTTASTVTFAVGQQTTTVSITVNGDTAVEGDETVGVAFSGAGLASSFTGTGTITNDDVDPNKVPMTKTLTTGADTGADFTTGEANDTFFATDTTLNTGDSLDGSEGVDVLKITAATATATTPTLVNIESIELVALHSALTEISLTLATGVTSVNLLNSKGGVHLKDVKNMVDLSARDSATDSNSALIVEYATSVVSGTSDTQKITLENSILPGAIAIDNVEFFDINVSGTNTTSNIIGAHTLNVSGDGSLSGEFRPSTDTGTFTSTASGAMNINFQSGKSYVVETGDGNDNLEFGSTNTVSVNSGGGNDMLHFDGSLDATDSINGGSGKDTLVLNSFGTASTVNKATGIEVLVSQNASSGLTASDYTSIHEFVFGGGPNNNRVNIKGVETEDKFVFAADQGQGDEAVRFEGQNAGQTLTMELQAQTGNNGEVVIHANSNSGNDNAAVGFQSNISSVNIVSTGVVGASSNANMVHAVDNNYKHYAFANDGGIANFTITGDHALNIGAKDGATMSASSDTFGFENAVNVNAADFTGDLKIAGSQSADTLTGGSGNDVFYGMSGDDTLRGNDGSDQFRFVGTNSTDTIKDFVAGSDKIGFNLFDFDNTTATTAGQTLSTSDYVDNRSGITSLGNADDKKMIELQSGLSTSQIQSDTGSAIEAYVMVFNTTTNKAELWYDNDWSSSSSRKHVATLDNTSELSDVIGLSAADFVEFVA